MQVLSMDTVLELERMLPGREVLSAAHREPHGRAELVRDHWTRVTRKVTRQQQGREGK